MEDFIREAARRHGLNRPTVVHKGDFVDLQVIEVPTDRRGQGVGTAFMKEVCDEADRRGEVLGLIPDNDRLANWFRRLGFQPSPNLDVHRISYVRFPR